jgi:hypothetical protein
MRIILLIAAVFGAMNATAEPFLAVENGFHCMQCHVSPAGGGSRNQYGALFSQSQLPARAVVSENMWTGGFADRFTLGMDLRGSLRQIDIDNVDDTDNFSTDRVTVYLGAQLNERISVYVDEQIAPGGSINRAAWARLDLSDSLYLRAGKMFLPFGLRLEDDSAFIRQLSNINFNTADNGLEIGYIKDAWSAQLAVSNGTSGASEIDDGKQISFLGSYVQPNWRVGISVNDNHTDLVDRTMTGVFAGLRTGPVTWLLEYDRSDERQSGMPDSDPSLAFAEANVRLAQGHYLKITAETAMSDNDTMADQDRYSVEYQYFPLSFTQLRLGARTYESDDPAAFLNRDEIFAQLHVFF